MADEVVISSDDEDVDIPSRDECEKRCQDFASLTGTDTALAMFFLQDRKWNLELSVNAFWDQNPPTDSMITGSTTIELENTTTTDVDPEPKRLRIISWNIDGLDKKSIEGRANGVARCIISEKPDIVLLQEVVIENLVVLKNICKSYQFIVDDRTSRADYFTAILLKKAVNLKKYDVIPFNDSTMGRSILKAEIQTKGISLTILTSHMESTKDFASERKKQLKEVFKVISKDENSVLFGGDFNMRDKELAEIGGLPNNVFDLWEVTGKRPEAQYTWDLQRNTNLQMPSKYQPKCRFDRLYLKHGQHKVMKPVYFELVGIQKLKSCNMFPSDHWGIMTHLDML